MLGYLRRALAGVWRSKLSTQHDIDFRALAENSNDVIFKVGEDGTAYYVSPSSERLFGWFPEEMIGTRPDTFVVPEDVAIIEAAAANHFAGKEGSERTVFRVRRKGGGVVWVEGSAGPVVNTATGRPEIVVTLRDVSERRALEEKLEALARTDGLTGLANRRAFDEALEAEWCRAKRHCAPLSLLLIDVDHFKRFNDRYGHQTGDDCLRTVAAAIHEVVRRPDDLAARYGGEEIAVILPGYAQPDSVDLGRMIRAAVAKLSIPHATNFEGRGIVTVSVGVATAIPQPGGSAQMPAGLLQAADMALYKAKSKGRDRVETALILTADDEAITMTDAA